MKLAGSKCRRRVQFEIDRWVRLGFEVSGCERWALGARRWALDARRWALGARRSALGGPSSAREAGEVDEWGAR